MDNLDQLQAKLDKILNPSMPEPVAIPEVKAEPINPVYYQIAAGMGNNDGAASMSPEEKDLRTLTPNQLIAKYGEENANYMLGNLARASAELQRNNLAERDWGETAWDSTTGVANAFVGGLGSIAAYGAGKVNAEAGVGLSDVVESLRRYTEENQSDALNARRRVGAAKDSLTQRDSDAQYNADIKNGDSELVAGFAQFGRDVVNSSVFDDSTLLAQGTADAIGSFLTAVPVAGAIRGAAKLLVPKATVRGIGLSGAMDAELGKWTVNRALSNADKLVWPAAIGTLESGGTYQQTVEDAINTLKQQGKTVGDKIEQINDTGQQAADRMFLPAAGLGTITRFGEKPFSVPSLRQAGTNILGRELPEEAGQGAVGTILSNQAIQDNIDPNRKIGQGVADATVQGAVYGSFAAGVAQGPGIAKQSVISAAKATLGYVDKRTALAAEKADDASPVGTKALKEKASTLVPNAEPVKQTLAAELSGTDLTPEEKDQGIKYANDLVDSLKVSVENEFDDTIPPELSAIISGSEHRIDAIQQLAKKVITTSDPNEKLLTAATLYQLLQPILDLQTNRPSSVDNLSPESQAVLKDYESLIANVNNSPTIKNAMKQIHEIMVAQGATVISPVMEEELNTPAGKQKVQSIITAANIAPDQGNLDANESILKHAKEGKLNLTPEQTTTLNASTALLRARKELEEKNKQFGLNATDIVSSEILTDRGVKDNNARSATQYTQEILSAVRRGNTLGAAQLLYDMGLFVKHMRNKVEAINKHYLNGNPKAAPVPYDALLPTTHQWVRSDTNPKALHKGGFVNTLNPDSIKFVQGVELEHKILADVYNSLTEVFPDLGIDRIEPLQLEKGISGAIRRTTQEVTKPVVKEEPKAKVTEPKVEDKEPTTEISSNAKGLAAALTNPTELAKSKGNITKSYPVNFNGKTYRDAEEAYQKLKHLATKDSGPNSTYNLMVDIIKAKLEQHPSLVSEITKQGGSEWILSSVHQPTKQNTVWETGGKNWFIKALNEVYLSQIKPVQKEQVKEPIVENKVQEKPVAVETPTPKQTVPVVEAKSEPVTFTGKMTFAYGSNKRSDVESDTTFDAIKAGERTATTRYTTDGKIDYWSKAKVGDIIEFSNKDGDIVRVEVTKPLTKLPSNTDGETWSKKEGWSIDYFNKNVKPKLGKAYQLEYKLIGKAEPKKAKTPKPVEAEPILEETKPPKTFELNDGQKTALAEVMEFIKGKKQVYSLAGPAGTGKTTVVNLIISALKKAGSAYSNVILSAPTHRANAVTQSKNPNENVITLHKLLSLAPEMDLENFDATKIEFQQVKKKDDPFPESGLIIIDESSMIGDGLYDFLMNKLSEFPDVKILFLGDLEQLRPIVKTKPGEKKVDPTDSKALTDTENQSMLTEVMRAKNPQLLDESTVVRATGKFTNTNNMKDSNGVAFTNNPTNFTNRIIQMFQSKEFLENRLLVRAVAYTNAAVETMNKKVRTALFGNDAPDYVPGDLLMGYNRFGKQDEKGSLPLANGIDYLVLAVGEIKEVTIPRVTKTDRQGNTVVMAEAVTILTQDVTIKDIYNLSGSSTLTFVIPSNTEATWKALGNSFQKLSNKAFTERDPDLFTDQVNKYVFSKDVKATVTPKDTSKKPYEVSVVKKTIDYGYAHTIHKSQGGTYTYVFVDSTSMGMADPDTQKRLRYVGLTRAERGSIMLVNDKTNITGVSPTFAKFTKSDERITQEELDSQFEQKAPVKEEEPAITPTPTNEVFVGEYGETYTAEQPVTDTTNKVDPKTFTNHSGGANGADTFWDIVGRPLGFTNHNHYKESGGTVSSVLAKAKVSITKLDEDQMAFAKKAIDKLFGKGFLERWSKKSEKDLQIRNYYQVANADGVFAIATLDLKNNRVNGGTNTAVQLGIKLGKPVYVWDTTTEQWFKFRGNKFVKTDTPVLTKNFAGVGTRKIANYSVPNERDSAGRIISWTTTKEKGEYLGEAKEAAAKQAIRDVYAKTLSGATPVNEELDNELPVEDNFDDYFNDESPIVTGNKNAVIKVKPDVVVPSKLKKLVQGIQNFFIQSFKFKGKETTRTDSVGSPLEFVKDALLDNSLFQEAVPNSKYSLNKDVIKAYRSYLGQYYDNLSNTLAKNLQDFLTVPNKKGVVRLNRINKGDPLHRYAEGKVLNLTEKVGDTYKYNQHLLELATLAGLQWFLTAGQTERRLEPREIAKLTGIPEGKLSNSLIDSILNTSDTGQLSQSLTNTIKSFWGVSGINTEMMAYTDGIAEAMAAEILRAFEELGMITKTSIYIDKATNQQLIPDPDYYRKLQELENDVETKKKIKTVIRLEVNRFDNDALYSFPTAIQEVVLIASEDVTYFGDDIPPVPQTQLGDETIKLSRKEKKAVANANKTGVKTNTLQANILMSATEQSIIIAFGGGIENEHMNINTLASIQGKNKTTLNAYRAMVDMLSKVNNVAEKSGIDPSDVVMRFPHTITSVGRAMMLGKYNIQSSKLLREVFLPTWSTLDLQNNQNHYVAFQLGVAQALGIKVHNEGPNSITLVQELLSDQLSPAVSLVQDWMEATDNGNAKELVEFNLIELARIFKVAQKGLTPNAFHALVEYVRYQRTEDKTKFTTALYLEADGVTNGPGNAIEMLTLGQFTAEWVTTVEKIGHSFAEPKAKHELDKNNPDLYKTGGINSVKHSQEIITKMKQSPDKEEIMQILGSLYSLLSMNVKGITYDPSKLEETGGVLANRDFFKNPLTILVYGSGIPGLASKAAKQMADNIYKRFSDANILLNSKEGKNLTVAQAMFPGDENAEQTYKKFVEDLNRIRSTTINTEYIDRKKVYVVEGVTQPKREYIKSELQKFTFSDSEIDAITQNITKGLVEAMYEGAVETVGRTVMQSSKMIQQATQIQSILLEAAFTKAIQDKIANRVATSKDTGYMKSDFISKQDFMDIMEELKVIAPYLKTPDQTFLAAKSGRYRNEKDEAIGYSLSLNSKYRTDPNIYIPTNAGVSGTPNLVIGLGDAYAILQAASDESMIGNLWIFDGINMPLDKILDYAPKLNKAAFEAWQNNPLRVIEESFRSFMGEKSMMIKALNETLNNEDLADQLNKSLRLYKTQDKLSSGNSDYALSIFNDLLNELKDSADSIDARHAAIARMANSVDQLAAAGVPYHNGITVDPTLDTPEKIAEQLNKYYQEELDKINSKPKAEPVKQMTPEEMDPITKDMLSNTVTDISSGVKILHAAGLLNLGRSINLSREQRKAYIQLVKSNKLEGYKVVFGSIEQIKKYRELYGYKRVDLDQETDNGFIDMNNKIIHLINPSVETLVHEMIHSATYGSVLNYYQNPSLNTKEVNDAIERTEGLMGEFLKLSPKELARLTPEQRVAINNVKAAIGEPGTNFDNSPAEVQAKALNEFMAWSLSNQQLIAAFKNVKLPTALRIAQEVIAIIKKFFTFKDKATGEIKEQDLQVPEDLFGNLLFNASIIINSAQPSLAETMVETTLFHSGTAKHITQLRETLIDKVALFLDKSGQAFNVALYNSGFAKVLTESADTVNSLVPIFGLSNIEQSTLHHVVAALSAQIQVDPLTIDGIQTLYAHTVVELAKQVDAGTYPKAKYDALIGRIGNPKIINGKSTLLPVFLGLGLIDTELRDALAKIDMPTKTKNITGTLNGGLENQANKMLDGLFKVLTGQRKAHDVSDALELLTERLTEIALKEDSAAKSVFNKPGINTDKANEWITDKIAVVADKGIALGKKLETSQYLAVKRLGSAITVLSMMATDKNGETVARGAIAMANKGNVWKPFRSLLTDFVGRSDSNAETYDLIKKVRAAVQQMRQTFRDKVPKIIAQKFTRPLDKKEWAILFRSMAKTDLSSLMDILSKKEIMEIFSNPSSINKHISMLETRIQNQDKTNWSLYQAKMKQLAKFMNTGVTGSNLLRNPYAIHRLLNETKPKGFQTMGRDAIHSIDQLTTLYAIQSLSQEDKSFMSDMVNEQSEGLEFIIDYLVGQNVTEITKLSTNPAVQMNYYKGHIPQINQSGASLIVAEDVNRADLLLQGYTRVGDYFGSNLDTNRLDKGYYFTDVSAKGAVAQGTIQNIQRTILGVDDFYGFTVGSNDRITDPIVVANITKRISRENVTEENLLPVFNENGAVIAYERSMQPEKLALLKPSEHLAEMIGVWRGRQLEEQLAQEINEEVIDKHYEMYLKDIANSPSSQKEYVDVLDPKQLDVVEQDMVSLFSIDTIRYMSGKNNGKFYVRKDVLDDMIGYRKASVSDIFTGKTRMNKPLQDAIRKVLIATFGVSAYRKAVKTERFLQNVVGEARTLIVVKSLVVPMFNIVSNIVQLVARGVPLATIVKSTPTKLLELRSYTMSQVKQVELEAEHRAASGDLRRQQVLESQIQAIKDGHKRLSIWPLIEAGEFSTISDIGNNSEDIDLFSGNTESWLDNKISKLPANAQTAVRYGMVTRDTALFQGLQKMVQYGDFIAKAVLYDDLLKRKGLTKEQALGKITDEFVNYDKLPGRARGYLEDTGLLWFYNYKLRITKIALSMMRNNPLHLLLAHAMPIPLGAGIATEDNFITKLLDGSLTRSIGPGMVVGAPLLNPWYNAVN